MLTKSINITQTRGLIIASALLFGALLIPHMSQAQGVTNPNQQRINELKQQVEMVRARIAVLKAQATVDAVEPTPNTNPVETVDSPAYPTIEPMFYQVNKTAVFVLTVENKNAKENCTWRDYYNDAGTGLHRKVLTKVKVEGITRELNFAAYTCQRVSRHRLEIPFMAIGETRTVTVTDPQGEKKEFTLRVPAQFASITPLDTLLESRLDVKTPITNGVLEGNVLVLGITLESKDPLQNPDFRQVVTFIDWPNGNSQVIPKVSYGNHSNSGWSGVSIQQDVHPAERIFVRYFEPGTHTATISHLVRVGNEQRTVMGDSITFTVQ